MSIQSGEMIFNPNFLPIDDDIAQIGSNFPVVLCSCGICAMAGGENKADVNVEMDAALAHVSTNLYRGENGARQYIALTQYRNADGSWSFSGDRNVDAVLIGTKITSTNLTYVFPEEPGDYGPYYDTGQSEGLLAFNELQRDAVRQGFDMIEGYTNLTFREVTTEEAREERATFRFGQTQSTSVGSAMGNFPHSPDPATPGAQNPSGDIWLGRTQQPYYTNPEKGNWGHVTILHEIGHTLGLKHGGDDYTLFQFKDYFGLDSDLFGTRSLEWAKDGQLWSLMTYSTAPNSRNVFNGDQENQATSYMMYDIAAMQYLYGANYNTQSGNTVYRWDATTGEGFINGVGQGRPAGNKVLETIWDGGGKDTYDLSNYDNGVSIDLRPGATSVLSQEQLPIAHAYTDVEYFALSGSVGNALLHNGDTRSLIENAIGGEGDDRLVGNQADNLLVGGAGNDFFDGMTGNDTIVGGEGTDTASFSASTAGVAVALNDGTGEILVTTGDGVHVLSGIENLAGTRFDDALTGDAGDNMLAGGGGGDDVLIGGAGDDRLIGSGFELFHRDLPDVTKQGTTVNNSRATAVSVDGTFDLADRFGVEQANTIPHTTINATTGVVGIEYYSFTAKAGATVMLDLDFVDGRNDAFGITLIDGTDRIIAVNYAAARRDEGSKLASDAFVTATIPSDGTYYAIVTGAAELGGAWVRQNMPVNVSYTMHISVEGAAAPEPVLVRTGSAVLDGDVGDDLMVTTMGNDVVSGGEGVDTVSFEHSYKGVSFDLRDTGAQDTGAGIDGVSGVENVVGSRQADRITGDDGDNVIDGYMGQDTLAGGAGSDTLSFARHTRGISFDLAAQGAAQAVRLGQMVEASGFENVSGSAFGDSLYGDEGANLIEGDAGNDLLSGDGQGRVGGRDTLVGGDGRDIASFAAFRDDLIVRLDGGNGEARVGDTVIAELRGIERLGGGSGNDLLEGDAAANDLHGGAGNDVLTGMDGDDGLEGGAGDDVIDGGAGRDTAVFAGTINTMVDLRLTDAQDTGHGRDTLRGIENLRLGSGTNIVFGNADDNVFQDGGGHDAINGGDGIDTVNYSRSTVRVTADLRLATAQVTGAGSDTLTGIENLVGGDFRNRFFGTAGNNVLTGGMGLDTLIGGDGNDTLIGGDGNDILVGEDLLVGDLSHVGRDDYIDGGAGWDTLVGGQGNDTLLGGSGNDTIVNGSRNVTLTNVGGAVALSGNSLDGGNDVIDGGDGIDNATLLFGGRTDSLSLDLSREQETNVLYSNGVAVGSVRSIERVAILGGNGANNFVGTAGYDALIGGSNNDTLIGGLGNDQLTGGHGDDYLDGGEGHDIVNFSTGIANVARGITLDLRIMTAQDTGQGMDTIRNVEQVVATQFSDRIIGGDENLVISEFLGGDDTLVGNGGNDDLSVTRFATYATASTILLDGGDGEDTLNFLGGALPTRTTSDTQILNRDIVTAVGGAGNDFITIRGVKTGIIDAGNGADVVGISIAGTRETAYDITLGTGRDELAIQWGNRDIASFDRDNIVRDFQAGVGGDLLGLTAIIGQGLFTSGGTDDNIGRFSPFLSGHVTLVKQGKDTILQADKDGRFGAAPWVTLMKLENTNAFEMVAANIYAYIPENLTQSVVFYDPVITQYMTVGENRLDGHGGRDSLQGAAGDDLLVGLTGDDFLNGFAGNDTLMGGEGIDYMVGGSGNDVYYVDDARDSVIEVTSGGTDLVRTSVDWALASTVENIEALGGAIRATGNLGANMLTGSATGQETLVGLAGDDTYVVRAAGTTIVEAVDGGTDRVVIATRAYTLAEGVAIEMMEAMTGSDAVDLTGNEFDQMLVVNAGLNVVDGRGGFDVVSYRNASVGVTVDGRTMRGTVGDALGDSYRNVEAFEGSSHADRLIAGNAGNWLHGRDGDDWLVSGAGNDNMLGGAGGDVFAFDTTGVSGRDRVVDWNEGDRIASSKQLRGADSSGLVTIGTSGLLLLDGTARGDTAEMVDQGGAVLRAMGRADGYWWYAYVSGPDAEFDGRVTEMATDMSGPAMGPAPGHAIGSSGSAHGSEALTSSPFYLYNAMEDAMSGGTVLFA